jgi:hypothetical protein
MIEHYLPSSEILDVHKDELKRAQKCSSLVSTDMIFNYGDRAKKKQNPNFTTYSCPSSPPPLVMSTKVCMCFLSLDFKQS